MDKLVNNAGRIITGRSPIEEQHDVRTGRGLENALAIDDLPIESHYFSICVEPIEFNDELELPEHHDSCTLPYFAGNNTLPI
jgi:hypothetical protein